MTTIQKLIREFDELKKNYISPTAFKTVDDCIHLAYDYLNEEEKQIIDAWKDGCYNEKGDFPKTAQEYFNITFKNK